MSGIIGARILYCDNCKVDTQRSSKAFWKSGEETWTVGDTCPNCKKDVLVAAETLGEID